MIDLKAQSGALVQTYPSKFLVRFTSIGEAMLCCQHNFARAAAISSRHNEASTPTSAFSSIAFKRSAHASGNWLTPAQLTWNCCCCANTRTRPDASKLIGLTSLSFPLRPDLLSHCSSAEDSQQQWQQQARWQQ